ncbi:unnamed protein product [Cuscuta campestris]|uniref:Uncharacterized protein n=1 Tax=Cuscuta campestris TaxID=132261 RepID=A0A484MHV7_9ASTE|nr:unnamed protein product [Cuscuta campestris]
MTHFHARVEPLELCGHTFHNDTLNISRVVLILLEGSEFGRTGIGLRGLGSIRFEDVKFPLTVKNDSEWPVVSFASSDRTMSSHRDFKDIPGKINGFYKGAPSICFTSEEENILAGKFNRALVGRSSGKVSLAAVEQFLIKGAFKEFKLRRINPHEILFIFKQEEDYQRWFLRRRWVILGQSITICKWTPQHSASKDSPIAPIWVEILNLPIHLNDHKALFALASTLGRPIKLDAKTVIGVKPDTARFCVEMDASISKPPKVHVRLGGRDLWLPCKYDNSPSYYISCSRFGHSIRSCRKKSQVAFSGNAPAGKGNFQGAQQDGAQDSMEWKVVRGRRRGGQHPRGSVDTESGWQVVPHLVGESSNHEEIQQPKDKHPVSDEEIGEIVGPSSILNHHEVDENPKPYPDLSYLDVSTPTTCMAIVPFVPAQLEEENTEPKPLMGSMDDSWIGTRFESVGLQNDSIPPYVCHSDGGDGDYPFDSSELEPMNMVTHCEFTLSHDNSPLAISCVYGAHTVDGRRELWNELQSYCPNKRWIVGGDFNAITSPLECKGKCTPNTQGMEDFYSCITNCKLTSPEPTGGIFTWSGVRSQGRTWRRLDRVMVNLDMLAYYSMVDLAHLPKANSDHKALLLHCKQAEAHGARPFRFINSWLHHDQFLKVVKDAWTKSPTVGGMRGLVSKLHDLKKALRDWNTKEFGNISVMLKNAEHEALNAQTHYENSPSDTNREAAQLANAKLVRAINNEVEYWKQKAHIKWLDKGDSNSKLFQAFVKGKQKKLAINHIISKNGKGLHTKEEICEEAISFFKAQFTDDHSSSPSLILPYIPKTITELDNDILTALPSMEEQRDMELFQGYVFWSFVLNQAIPQATSYCLVDLR